MIAIVPLAAGAVALLVLAYRCVVPPITTTWAAADWPETRCRIVTSRVTQQSGPMGLVQLDWDVSYRYRVNGSQYIGYRLDPFSDAPVSTLQDERQLAERYPAGSKTSCLFDPDRPDYAILTDSWQWTSVGWLATAVLGMLAVAVALGVGVWMNIARVIDVVRGQRAESAFRRQYRERAAALKAQGIPVTHENMHDPSVAPEVPPPNKRPG